MNTAGDSDNAEIHLATMNTNAHVLCAHAHTHTRVHTVHTYIYMSARTHTHTHTHIHTHTEKYNVIWVSRLIICVFEYDNKTHKTKRPLMRVCSHFGGHGKLEEYAFSHTHTHTHYTSARTRARTHARTHAHIHKQSHSQYTHNITHTHTRTVNCLKLVLNKYIHRHNKNTARHPLPSLPHPITKQVNAQFSTSTPV